VNAEKDTGLLAATVRRASTEEQAAELECLLPKLMRRLFQLQSDHPVSELPLAQLRLCTILQGGPRSMTMLGEELAISVSAVTQIADRLERAGLVERVAEADDRRMKLLRLTECGAKLMCDRREMRVRRVCDVLEQLAPDERAGALRALRALLDASTASAPGASE
jgi:DNA-binding MarR family transcriptional regulator